jgi:EAL domain-containing protein (putative c-di-GMP-specific phosphodiesterase class I)
LESIAARDLPATAKQIADVRFLVVDDHDAEREEIHAILKARGARHVYPALTGEAALAILEDPAQSVDVVMSALDMAGMDGMEFIRHIGHAKHPVSLIIASKLDRALIAAVETMSTAYGVKLLGIIEKPVTAEKIEEALLPPLAAKPVRVMSRPLSLEEMGEKRPVFALDEIMQGLADDQFEPFFQPKVEMIGGRTVGAKALARWRHPVMGKVEPYAFLAPLEESGRIDELTWVMLRKAAACCSAWRAAGVDGTVSVRLALGSLADPGLADRVTELVVGQGLDPPHMILETTGLSTAIRSGNALENLARLRLRGFGLSVEDCGTGPSSLAQLSRIAFTEVKIDQAFAVEAASEESSKALLLSMLATARSLGIHSVAEGVETQLDWDLCAQLGCDIAQGFFVAAPIDAAAYLEWAVTRSRWAGSTFQ